MDNILINKLPTEFDGIKINTSFRRVCQFEILMQDKELSNEEKIRISLHLFFDLKTIEGHKIEELISAILKLYTCNYKKDKEKVKKEISNNKIKQKENIQRIYSFEYDDFYIFSAFLQQYGINLQKEDMHWYEFKSLFDGLTEDTKFIKIIQYRSVDLSDIKDKEMRKFYIKQKKIYKLPDMRSEEEKENDFGNAFW